MKKIGLTKKTFLVLIVGFMIVLSMTGMQAFTMYKERYLSYEFSDAFTQTVLGKFENNYSIEDPLLIQSVKDTYNNINGFSALLNTEKKTIAISSGIMTTNEPTLEVTQVGNGDSSISIKISQNDASLMDDYMKAHPNEQIVLKMNGDIKEEENYYYDELGNQIAYPKDEQSITLTPNYLAINDKVVREGDPKDAKEYEIVWYTSSHYASVPYEKNQEILMEIMDVDFLEEEMQKIITDYDFNTVFERTPHSSNQLYKDIEEGTIFYQIGDLRNYHYTEEHPMGEVQGYFVEFGYIPYLNNTIMEEYIEDNYYVYLVSFAIITILAMIISHFITHPILKVASATEAIAKNQFDVKLENHRHDEIGMLTRNINIMSDNLYQTIHDLNTEIDRVKELESVRKEFIANFTHEIKTPLGVINGYAELLEDAHDEITREKYIHIINEQTDKINKLVLAMLELSRLQSGKVELDIRNIDLEDVVTSVIETYELSLQKKNIKIYLDSDEPIIQADRFKIEMVIKNFINNAIKHTKDNGLINIKVGKNRFEVENEGYHFSENDIKNVWETFVSSDHEGTGLGLPLSRSILELHHFSYGVINTPKGVLFYFDYSSDII